MVETLVSISIAATSKMHQSTYSVAHIILTKSLGTYHEK